MYIDTHCHLNFEDYDKDKDEVIRRAFDNGVNAIINVSADLKSNYDGVLLSQKYPSVYSTVGVHPHYVCDVNDKTFLDLENLIKSNNKIVAIGEVGLDYYRNLTDKNIQRDIFLKFIDFAKKFNLPLIFHVRDAWDDFLNILDELPAKIRGVVHCFSGDKDFAKKIMDRGMMISFTGSLTFKNASALREVCEYVPLEFIMLETDAPFLAPQEHRGKRNEPMFVTYVAKQVALLHNCSSEYVGSITTKNATNFFNIKV